MMLLSLLAVLIFGFVLGYWRGYRDGAKKWMRAITKTWGDAARQGKGYGVFRNGQFIYIPPKDVEK